MISMFFHMTVLTNSFNLDDEIRFPPVYEHRAGILLRFAPAPMRLLLNAGEGCCLRGFDLFCIESSGYGNPAIY